MKGIIILLFTVCAAVVHAQNTILVEECPKDQETDWTIELLLRHEYCNKFYMCTFGKPVEYTCPADLWFNLETQQCDWRHNVDCTDRYVPDLTTTTPEPTTPEPTATETSTPEPTTLETTTPEPTTLETTTPEPTTPEPTTTTTEPTTTTSTTSTTRPAPTTTTSTTTTTTPAPTTTTSTSTTTTPAPTTTTSTSTTTTPAPTTTTTTTTPAPTTTTKEPISFLPNGCPTNPHIHWLLPHETDCNAFYYCVWGQLVVTSCPATLHFNREIQVCDWPSDAGCPASLNKHLSSRQQMR